MAKPVVAVYGPGEGASLSDLDLAYEIGMEIARCGWILLTGGRNVGVMDAACRGARSLDGFIVGILPGASSDGAAEGLDLAIRTDMGSGRNNLNALSCDGAIACGVGLGTLSEVALALKAGKPVVVVNWNAATYECFAALAPNRIETAESVNEACNRIAQLASLKT